MQNKDRIPEKIERIKRRDKYYPIIIFFLGGVLLLLNYIIPDLGYPQTEKERLFGIIIWITTCLIFLIKALCKK